MNDLYRSSLRPRSVDRCDINGRERARRGRGRSKRRDTRALKSVERRNKIKEKKKKERGQGKNVGRQFATTASFEGIIRGDAAHALSFIQRARARTIAKVSVINANGRALPADVCFTVKIFGFDSLNRSPPGPW